MAVEEDGPKVLAKLFGDAITKLSQIPDDAAAYEQAVSGVEEMAAKNPFGRKAV